MHIRPLLVLVLVLEHALVVGAGHGAGHQDLLGLLQRDEEDGAADGDPHDAGADALERERGGGVRVSSRGRHAQGLPMKIHIGRAHV